MKVALGTIEVSDYERRAVAYRYGDRGLATRSRVRGFVLYNGTLALDDLCRDYSDHLEQARDAAAPRADKPVLWRAT